MTVSLLQMLGGGAPVEEPPRPLPEAQLEEMMRYHDRYRKGAATRFNVGDVVMPERSSMYSGHGEPAIVIEVRPRAFHFEINDSPAAASFGYSYDFRLMAYSNHGTVSMYWAESACFVPYDAEEAARLRKVADAEARAAREGTRQPQDQGN